MCDTCNVPLYIAESPRADQLRREIRVLIARGETKPQIKDDAEAALRRRRSSRCRRSTGFSLAAYLVPIARRGSGCSRC